MSTRRERANRRKARSWHLYAKSKCPRCGGEGPHFVPPCFGDPGFFVCDVLTEMRPKEETA